MDQVHEYVDHVWARILSRDSSDKERTMEFQDHQIIQFTLNCNVYVYALSIHCVHFTIISHQQYSFPHICETLQMAVMFWVETIHIIMHDTVSLQSTLS